MVFLQEKLSVLDFVDTSTSTSEPDKPLPIEVTPFTHVEEVKDLKQLSQKLRNVNEFAVNFVPCNSNYYSLFLILVQLIN